ncbi:MAG: hypothetical protein J6A21_06270 [Lentisphaeria bacterium]|nr:hypothetical protein [Lentisphaeria bacterium]
MRKMYLSVILILFGLAGISAEEKLLPQGMQEVTREGSSIRIKSHFSSRYFLERKIALGQNKQFNFVSASLLDKKDGEVVTVHRCLDDATPLLLNSTYIGANHGCSDADTIFLKDHGYTEKDLGKVLNKGKVEGEKFYIIAVLDKDRFATLSDPYKNPRRPWAFSRTGGTGKAVTLFDNGKELKGAKSLGIYQYRPCARFHYQKYFADGKELEDGQTVQCRVFRMEESYDILRPDSMLENQKKNPGKKVDLKDPSIQSVLLTRLAYDFRPDGSCVVESYVKAHCDFYLSIHGAIQSATLVSGAFGRRSDHFYYIPKTVPFKGKLGGKEHTFDFLKGENFYVQSWPSLAFSEKSGNIADVNNPPDSAIQFLGRTVQGKFQPVFGYALGYSMTEGDTVPAVRSKQARTFWWVHSTRKTYPTAVGNLQVKAGREFQVYAYRHYFDPAREGLSGTMYSYELKGARYIYLDYQKSVERELVKLPDCEGKKLSVVEKTPSVSFEETQGGILLTVKDGYGRLVLKAK